MTAKHRSYWGVKWIILPNSLYGSWEWALYGYAPDLPASEKRIRKYEKLQGFE